MENITKLGPIMWYTLHYICYHNKNDKKLLDFLKIFGYLFKCPHCQHEYLAELENIKNPNQWLFNFHNKVNIKLKKEIFTFENLKIYDQEPNYTLLIEFLQSLSVNNDESLTDLSRFRRFLKIVYNLKPFNFKPKEIICLLNSRNMGISRLKYLFLHFIPNEKK